MGRQNIKLIKLPLTEGVYAKGTLYNVGPRLRTSRSYYNDGGTVPPKLIASTVIHDLNAISSDLSGMGEFAGAILLGARKPGAPASQNLTVFRGGIELTGPLLEVAPLDLPWSIVYWPNAAPGNVQTPTTYMVNKSTNHVWKTTDGAARTELTEFSAFISAANKGASVAIIHLQQLWLANFVSSRLSRVWFSDPLRPDIWRAGQYVEIEDEVTSMFLVVPSDINVGAQTQLIFGGTGSIAVLDGSPLQGNAILRKLSTQIGILSQNNVTTTPYGAVFVGTDTRIYLIPPGATEIVPISEAIEDLIFPTSDATLVWDSPDILMALATTDLQFQLSFRNPQKPKWWGPNSTGGGIHAVSGGAFVDATGLTKNTYVIDRTVKRVFKWPASTQPISPTVRFTTGYFFEPGMRVRLRRVNVLLGPVLSVGGFVISASCTQADGTVVSFAVTVPQALTKDAMIPLHFQDCTQTDAFQLLISGSDQGLEFREIEIEYVVIGRQR